MIRLRQRDEQMNEGQKDNWAAEEDAGDRAVGDARTNDEGASGAVKEGRAEARRKPQRESRNYPCLGLLT